MANLELTPSEENTLTSHGYKILKYLGEGAYAKVYLTEYKTSEEITILLACKIINTTKAAKTFVKKFLPRELDVMIRVSHPHIVHTHSIFQRRDKYYMCMRYAENGDLLHYITKHGTLLESQARVWIRQLSLAVQYLHEMEICHRDIKCENILITSNHNVKLSDFGFARVCINSEGTPMESETYCGSLSYCAPDIIRGKPYFPKPTDLWAMGVVLFVMLNKCMPFDDTNMRKMFDQQMSKKYKIRSHVRSLLSPQCKTVLKNMLEPDPTLRITCTQIMESDWMNMDTRLASLTIAEEAALNKAKQDRKFAEARKTIEMSKIKSQGSMSKANELSTNKNTFTMEEANISVSTSDQVTLSQRGYTLKKKLNEGSYAKVYLTEYKKPDKTSTLACKVINTQVAPEDFVKKFLPREIAMLMKLSHPHIVPIFSIFQRRHKYFIFMRLMEQGDMLEYVIHNGRVVEDQARIWLRQLALAIQYMHELEIAHRDIKCENVLITNNLNVKLSDFGFSRSCVDKRLKAVYSETYCGSLSYTAPEILHGRPYAPKPTDVWSLGVVLFVILNRSMPFSDKELKALYVAQMAKKWSFRTRNAEILSSRCIEITTQMMEPLVSQRVKINDVVNSAWIAMDARLTVLSNPEKSALQKAQKEKADIIKKLNENSYPSSDDTEGTFNINSI